MYFQALQQRFLALLRGRVRSGELTERGLARLTGISQPHIHNVLKGIRTLSPELTDQVLRRLKLDVFALCTRDELSTMMIDVGVLDTVLGPGHCFRESSHILEKYPFPIALVSGLRDPLAA